MKKILFISALMLVTGITAQISIQKSSISTSGGSHTNASKTIVFAIGETNINEADMGNIHLSEGFVGPDISIALGITDYGILSGISVYPNPVAEDFTISLPLTGIYDYYLYNMQGKQIFHRLAQGIKQNFNISRLPSAGYLLIVIDRKKQKRKSIKIIKK